MGEGRRGFSSADLILVLVAFCWGGHFGIVKNALPYIDPMAFALLRFMVASGSLFVILRLTERSYTLSHPGDFSWCMMLGLFCGLNQVFWMTGLQYTTSAKSSLLIATSPLFVTLFTYLHGERPSRRALTGIITAFAGVVIVMWPGGPVTSMLGGGELLGDVLTLLAAGFWGAYVAYGGKVLAHNSSLKVTTWTFFWAAVVLVVPGTLPLAGTSLARLSGPAWLALLYSAFVAGVFGFVAWYKGVQHIGPVRVAIYQYMVPVVATVLAFLLWEEPFTAFQALGALIVFFGIGIMRWRDSEPVIEPQRIEPLASRLR